MKYVTQVCKRLAEAAELSELLDAAYDAFEDVISVARQHQEDGQTAFPAFVLVACAAANGRDWIAEAPSLPASAPGNRVHDHLDDAGVAEVAPLIAAIAGEVAIRLTKAGPLATDTADRSCCEHAAAEATAITALMGGSSPP